MLLKFILPLWKSFERYEWRFFRLQRMIKYHSYEWKKKNQRRFWCWNYAYDLSPLLGLSWLVTLKDFFGIKPISLDDDPIKVQIKKACILL